MDGHGLQIPNNINTITFIHGIASSAGLLLSTEVQPLALDYGNGDYGFCSTGVESLLKHTGTNASITISPSRYTCLG